MLAATTAARAELANMRDADPRYFMRLNERDLANRLHPRYWTVLCDELEPLQTVSIRDQEPHREITFRTPSCRSYTARVKRHSTQDRVQSHGTVADREFWNGGVQTFDNMDVVTGLAIGYRWDRDLREVLDPVISYREGKSNVVWAFAIDSANEGALTMGYRDITPGLPKIDLLGAARAEDEEGLAIDE